MRSRFSSLFCSAESATVPQQREARPSWRACTSEEQPETGKRPAACAQLAPFREMFNLTK